MPSEETPVWEASKENVIPLKEGRHIDTLNAALCQNPKSSTNQNKIKEFEQLIKDTCPDDSDPLDRWQSYINWLIEAFPGDTKRTHLMTVYERCAKHFQYDERYKDDGRYVRIWILYADSVRDAGDLLQFMYNRDIGTKRAVFYIAWSMYFEAKGNLRRADEVFREGIARKARPADKLKTLHKAFELRMADKIRTGMDGQSIGTTPLANDENTVRPALGTISIGGRLPLQSRSVQAASPERHGQGKRSANDNSGGVAVYEGDDVDDRPTSGQWGAVPNMAFKENTRVPSLWTKERVKHTGSTLPPAGPEVAIFEDDEEGVGTSSHQDQRPRHSLNQGLRDRLKRQKLESEHLPLSRPSHVAANHKSVRKYARPDIKSITVPGPKVNERLVGMAEMFGAHPLLIDEIRANLPRYKYTKPLPPPLVLPVLDSSMQMESPQPMETSITAEESLIKPAISTSEAVDEIPLPSLEPVITKEPVQNAIEPPQEMAAIEPPKTDDTEELTSRLKRQMLFDEASMYQQTPTIAVRPSTLPPRFSTLQPDTLIGGAPI
eukprot:Ihof_evm2s867 gene=Ihof_evmTU2s867